MKQKEGVSKTPYSNFLPPSGYFPSAGEERGDSKAAGEVFMRKRSFDTSHTKVVYL